MGRIYCGAYCILKDSEVFDTTYTIMSGEEVKVEIFAAGDGVNYPRKGQTGERNLLLVRVGVALVLE